MTLKLSPIVMEGILLASYGPGTENAYKGSLAFALGGEIDERTPTLPADGVKHRRKRGPLS